MDVVSYAPVRVAQSFGSYGILAQAGKGGTGEVYRARDRRRGRDVALKILAGTYTQEQDRVRRFRQEATAASALNHPGNGDRPASISQSRQPRLQISDRASTAAQRIDANVGHADLTYNYTHLGLADLAERAAERAVELSIYGLRPIANTLFIVRTNITPRDRAGVAMIGSPRSLVATWRNARSAATMAIAPSSLDK